MDETTSHQNDQTQRPATFRENHPEFFQTGASAGPVVDGHLPVILAARRLPPSSPDSHLCESAVESSRQNDLVLPHLLISALTYAPTQRFVQG
jgi:hypothetical protein